MAMTSDPENSELLGLEEAARFLGTSRPTLYRWLGQGEINGLKAGKQWRFRKADLVAFLERGPAQAPPPPADALAGELEFFADALRQEGADVPEESGDEAGAERGTLLLADRIIALALHRSRGALCGGEARSSSVSDIHLEPVRQGGEAYLLLRYRVDGLLHEVRRRPIALHEALIQSFKQRSGMDPAERYLPQDGRIRVPCGGKEYDLRLSCLPTLFGEAVVARVHDRDRTAELPGLDQLGLAPEDQSAIRGWLRQPHGLILAAGPAGSGKTTLLYSCLKEIAGPGKKAITVEDPVEHALPDTTPVQVNKKAGLTFAAAMRAVLRHDPDILLVGEMREAETARMAQELALTGSLVLAPIQAHRAAEAVRRLIDTGVEPIIGSRTLVGIIATRLARRVCPFCKAPAAAPPSDTVLSQVKQWAAEGGYTVPAEATFSSGRGCDECRKTGYKGRLGLYEVMTWNEALTDALLGGAGAQELAEIAVEHGMRTLLADGIRKAVEGHTTLDEVLRVTASIH